MIQIFKNRIKLVALLQFGHYIVYAFTYKGTDNIFLNMSKLQKLTSLFSV